MPSRRGWIAVLVVLAASIGVAVWFRRTDAPPDVGELSRADGEAPAGPAPAAELAASPRALDPVVATARIVGRVTRGGAGVAARVVGWDLGRGREDEIAADDWGREFRMRGIEDYEPADREAWLAEELRAGVALRLAAPSTREAETTADASGAFALPVPPSNGHWLLLAEADDGATGVVVSRGPVSGSREGVEIALAEGAERLALRVVDARDRPVAGVVHLELASAQRTVAAIAGTHRLDESGRAVFGHLPRRPHVVIVAWGAATSSTGRSIWTSTPLEIPYGGECKLVVGVAGPGVRGVVRDTGGAPIAGAIVSASVYAAGAQMVLRAVTGSDGTFALEGSAELLRDVTASASGYEPRSATPDASGAPVELRLRAVATMRGRVVAAATGAPVAGVRVIRAAISNRFGVTQEDDFEFARSAADGRFTLPAPRDVASIVVAYGGGWMSAELDGARVDGFQPKVVAATDDRSGEIDLRVVPAGRLEGAVFDADGHAVAGATVSLSQSDRWRGHCGNCYSRRPILPYLPDPDPVVTVADGRFVFDTVKPGLLYEVRASHEQLSADDEVTLDDPGTTRITLTLPRLGDERSPSPVDVVVKDEDGRAPIVGADVELISEGAPSRHASTGADGIARFDGVPGVGGAASVRAEGHVWGYSGSLSRAPLAGESRRSLAVALARTYDVRGRVVDPDGRPIPVANVSLWQRGGATQHEAAWTADGNFVFHDIAAGEFTLSSTLRRDGRDFVAEQKGAAGADGAEIVVRLTERAPPTVAAPATKSPATMAPEDVTIRVVGPDGVLASTGLYTSRTPETLREYEFHLRFRAGSFTTDPRVWGWEVVDVFDARSAVGERLAPGSSRALSAADLGTTVEVRLERAVSIGGRVVGSAGDPVAGARVAAHVPSKKRHDGPRAALATATTDARGAFTLEGLGREAYELEVDVPPAYLTPPATAVTAPAEGTIIALRPAIRPTITIVDEAGAPVANATVVVGRPGTIRWVSSSDRTLPRTGPRGRVTLDRLDSGAVYDVAVEDARFAARFLPLRRDGWSPADTTITVATPATIEGRIVGADHQPIASSWVCVVTSETAGRETSLGLPRVPVAPDGSFTIGMLARGDVWLRFGVGTGGVERVVRVAAPSSGVELVTEGGPTLVFRFEGVREGQAASIVATLTTWAADGRSAEAAMSVAASPDGVVRFPGLPKDRRFTLHAVFGDGDLIGWIADLGVEPSPVVVRLVPGGTIRGTVRYPSVEAAADGAWIEVEGRGFRANASVKKDGAFELKAIPPGRWHVTAMSLGPNRGGFSLPGGAEAWRPPSAEAEASPGESIDLTLVTPGPR